MATNGASRILARRAENGRRSVSDHDVKTPVNVATQPRSGKKARTAYYLLLNIANLIVVFLLSLLDNNSGHNPALYLVILVALLSSPLLFSRSVIGPYIILWVAAPFFFIMFGLGDFVSYLTVVPSIYVHQTNSIMSNGEMGILTGLLSLFIGYASAVGTLRSKSGRWFVNEWPASTTLIVGLVLFTLGMIATFIFQIAISLPTMAVLNAIVLGRMVGDLGEVLLAYVLASTRNRAITILILSLILIKVPLGILLNSKQIGVQFIVIYLVVAWIYNKHLPLKMLLASSLIMALMFPLAYQYRDYMGTSSVSVGETLEDISGNLDKALSKEVAEQQNRGLVDSALSGFESIAGRADVKPAVELIMARAGKNLPYQNGHTLSPLLYILIPRFILPDKPDVSVGQLFNREFKLSASPDTWITTSFIGELYWNFSWIGIVIGMLVLGYTFGTIGSLTNMDAKINLVRLLLVLITIATLVLRFETGIAQQYSAFIRSLIIIFFLHALFGRRRSRKSA